MEVIDMKKFLAVVGAIVLIGSAIAGAAYLICRLLEKKKYAIEGDDECCVLDDEEESECCCEESDGDEKSDGENEKE
jgi:hypothetical protein